MLRYIRNSFILNSINKLIRREGRKKRKRISLQELREKQKYNQAEVKNNKTKINNILIKRKRKRRRRIAAFN